jgi:nicotinate-nucleotide--dimethylbenzimidazole phosphoribosyltransferase
MFQIPSYSDEALRTRVEARWNSLTKPPGSLGRLEELVAQLAQIQATDRPVATRKTMHIFCADHGIATEGVSPFPQAVTAQMVKNFVHGGAAICVLCRQHGITPVIIDAGVNAPPEPGVRNLKIGMGTGNFAWEPAMDREQAAEAIGRGARLAHEAKAEFDIAGIGEMGIANTTAAAAILSVFAAVAPALAAGRGAGLDSEGVKRKAVIIDRAIALHRVTASDPLGALASIGGFEIAMMAGFILGAAEARLPVVVDGFIAGSAAVVARAINERTSEVLFYSHRSAEHAHRRMLDHLHAQPILDLDMRLGEGTGAALAMSVIDSAVRLYSEMATFEEAGVANRD